MRSLLTAAVVSSVAILSYLVGDDKLVRREVDDPHAAALRSSENHSIGTSASAVDPQATAVLSSNVSPNVPIARPSSYEEAADLFRIAIESSGSSSAITLANGWNAARICIAARADWPVIERESQADTNNDQRRVASMISLQSRCRGFLDSDKSAVDSIRSRIRDAARLNDEIWLRSTAFGPMTGRQFRRGIADNNWMLADAAMPEIISSFILQQGYANAHRDEIALLVAALKLSLCDVGRNCSGTSVSYLFECARFSRCSGSLEENIKSDLAAPDISKLQKLRAAAVKAWATQDAAYFGPIASVN